MSDIVSITVSAGVGAFFAFSVTYLAERFKRRNVISDASRQAYASWFTAEALMMRRIDVVCEKLVGFPTDRAKHEALVIEVRSLVDEGRTLVTAMNKAFLTEKSRYVRKMLDICNTFLVEIVSDLEFAGRHYEENLDFHEYFNGMTEERLSRLSHIERDKFISLRDRFQKHDAECPFKSRQFREKLGNALARVHKQMERLRETLAGTLSR